MQPLPLVDDPPRGFAATRNACNVCTPLGACLVFRGIERAIPLLHGSQGCSTYIRRYLIGHFREPVDIASSNFSESAAVHGGRQILHQGLENVIRQYGPELIGIASTCLSETIGDDINLYVKEFHRDRPDRVLPELVHVSTPSYRDTHAEGFHAAVRAVVETLAQSGPPERLVNLLPGMVSPADLRYLKEVAADFDLPAVVLPDYSDSLDGGTWADYERLPSGGTTIAAIRKMGRAAASIEFGSTHDPSKTAGCVLRDRHAVPRHALGLPIGIRQTDAFFDLLSACSDRPVPAKHVAERGRLVDAYIDAHKYLAHTRALIYGEEDLVVGLAAFVSELGIKPALCGSGGRSGRLGPAVKRFAPDAVVLGGVDFLELEDAAGELACDIMIGSSKGYPMARKLGKPLVRLGFPIHDRIGANRILHLGYRGAHDLLDRITNTRIAALQDGDPNGYMNM